MNDGNCTSDGYNYEPVVAPVTVIVPVKNNSKTIADCLEGLLAQEHGGDKEIIVIDSGSTDGSLDIVRKYPVTIHQIRPEAFNHGDTRNLGVNLAKGDFVVFTVADATPRDDLWISGMLRHFRDPEVMAVSGLQMPPPGKEYNPLERFKPINALIATKIMFPGRDEFANLSPEEKSGCCRVDDVTAMYRRSALKIVPFPRVVFGEDMLWAKEALARGWAIVFDPEAQVYHYHEQTFSFSFRRSYIEQYYIMKNFTTFRKSRPLMRTLLSHAYQLSKEKCSLKEKTHWLGYNIKATLASWLGAKTSNICARLFKESFAEKACNLICSHAPTPQR